MGCRLCLAPLPLKCTSRSDRRAAAQPAVVMQAWRANRHSGAQHGMHSRRSRQVQQALQAKQAKQAQRDRHSQKEAQSMWR